MIINNKSLVSLYLSIGLCLCLIGCASNRVMPFVDPQYGMTKQQMLGMIGRPESIEIYKKSDQSRVEFYIYSRKYGSSQTIVPVCLINNKVVGWGKSYYEDHISQDDIRIK
jgi:hypothetical protein